MKRVLFFLLGGLLGPARAVQAQAPPLSEQQVMDQAAFIFEGTVVRTAEYFNRDSSRLYYASVVRIARSVKGTLPNRGTVQVVYRGPAVQSVEKDPHTGVLTIGLPVPPKDGIDDTQGTMLPRNKPVVFFCRALPAAFAPRPPRLAAGSPPPLEIVGLAFFIFHNPSIQSDVGGHFADADALYRHLNAVYQVPLPQARPEGP